MFGLLDMLYNHLVIPSLPGSEGYEEFFIEDNKKRSNKTWICFAGWGMRPSKLKKVGMIPRSGRIITIHGPKSVVGKDPKETIIAVTRVEKILRAYIQKEKLTNITFYGWSTGCIFALYFANKFPCKRLFLVSPGFTLADVMYESINLVFHKELAKKGGFATAQEFLRPLKKIGVQNNYMNLPKKIFVYAGKYDKYIPYEHTQQFISFLRKKRFTPIIESYRFFDHVTLALFLGMKERLKKGAVFH